VDGNDLAAVMADAGMEPAEETAADELPKVDAAKADDAKSKTAAKGEPDKDNSAAATSEEDEEDGEGLTAKERQEWSKAMQKRLGRKHRQLKEAEEFAAHQVLEKQAAESRASEAERKLRELQPVKEAAKEPLRQDFKTDDEYIEARADWKADQKLAAKEAAREQAELDAGVERRFKNAMEAVPDFQRVIEANPLQFPEYMRAYVRESEMSAEICYHFAKDPQALAKIVALHPMRQLVELGKIETRLQPFGSSASSSKADEESEPSGKAKASPSATDTGFRPGKARSDAPVIKPLSSSDGAQVEVDPEKMTTRQMIEDFQRTKKVNLGARKRH
jgi:hypothetical protein